MSRKVAAWIWAVLAFLIAAVVVNELLDEARPGLMLFGTTMSAVSGWLAFRLWRGPSRTIAIIAACTGAFLGVFLLGAFLDRSDALFPTGIVAVALVVAGGFLPLWSTGPSKP